MLLCQECILLAVWIQQALMCWKLSKDVDIRIAKKQHSVLILRPLPAFQQEKQESQGANNMWVTSMVEP